MGEDLAGDFEKIVHLFYPGAGIRGRRGQGVYVDVGTEGTIGARQWKRIVLSGLNMVGGPPKGPLVYGSLEVADDAEDAIVRLDRGEALPAQTAPMLFGILRLGANGEVIGSRKGVVDAEASLAELNDILPSVWTNDMEWPTFEYRYAGFYRLTDGIAMVSWDAVLDTASMTLKERYPIVSTKRSADGTKVDETWAVKKAGLGIEMKARQTGRIARFQCPAVRECVVPVSVVMGASAGSSGVVPGAGRQAASWTDWLSRIAAWFQ